MPSADQPHRSAPRPAAARHRKSRQVQEDADFAQRPSSTWPAVLIPLHQNQPVTQSMPTCEPPLFASLIQTSTDSGIPNVSHNPRGLVLDKASSFSNQNTHRELGFLRNAVLGSQ